jgi:DNA-binding MarR family transcriptional regulator
MTDDLLRVGEPQGAYDAVIPAPVRYDKLPHGAKLLYGEIRSLCRRQGYCWASNGALARNFEVSPWTVSIWLKALEEHGHIAIEPAPKERAHRRIYLAEAFRKTQRPAIGKTQRPINVDKINVVFARQAEQIYSAYPRKAERPRAIGAIKAALKNKKVSFDDLLAKTKAFAQVVAGAEHRYIKHPATWYNNECWNDSEEEWMSIIKPERAGKRQRDEKPDPRLLKFQQELRESDLRIAKQQQRKGNQ